MLKTTEQHKAYWADRKIDWAQAYTSTWNHPHREVVMDAFRDFKFKSVFEIGCASAPNLIKLVKTFKGVEVGGMDISHDAIELAKETLPNGFFLEGSAEDILMSDESTDIVLSDMALIYIGSSKILKTLKEMRRICRTGIVLCEFHSTSWLKRMALRFASGYFAYNYRKLLDEAGFYDIKIKKMPKEAWEDGEPQKTFCYVITARR